MSINRGQGRKREREEEKSAYLAKKVVEGHVLDLTLSHLLDLLVVKVLELVHAEHAVAVEVQNAEPVLDARRISFVFFGDEEPDEVVVAHEAVAPVFAPDHGAGEDSVDDSRRDG